MSDSKTLEIRRRTYDRFDNLREECNDQHLPELTDTLLIESLMDEWYRDSVKQQCGNRIMNHLGGDAGEYVQEWADAIECEPEELVADIVRQYLERRALI